MILPLTHVRSFERRISLHERTESPKVARQTDESLAQNLSGSPALMRVCLVYDCLYPYTVGGAERWYSSLAERLAREGHEVTYLTLRQWERGHQPALATGVRVCAVGPRMALYVGGRRRIMPPLVFGAGVLWHLLRHGRGYDVVHTASFPYFSLLGAAAARPLGRYALVVDWHEVWSRSYWRAYLGAIGGRIGAAVQRLCARVPQRAFCFSRMHAGRLRAEGLRGDVTVLEGEYAGSLELPEVYAPGDPVVVFAGRLIPEKRAPLGVAAVALAAQRIDGLRGEFYGDGPERAALAAAIVCHGAQDTITAPGFVETAVVERSLGRALCLLLPSSREGYGLVVVEASARGTPSIVVTSEDNAATELVQDGVNGVLVDDPSPEAIAEAIVRVSEAGLALRQSTAGWFAEHAERLSLDSSLRTVLGVYSSGRLHPAA